MRKLTTVKLGRALSLSSALFLFYGCEMPGKAPVSAPASPGSVSEGLGSTKTSKVMSPRERTAFYRWLFREMQQQIFLDPAKAGGDEVGWVNVMSQGGSVEGIYRGLVLSEHYRALEVGGAPVAAVRFFAKQILLAPLVERTWTPVLDLDAEKLVKRGLDSPLFSLKRELGEALLREIEVRKGEKEQLAVWYANIAVEWAELGIDFGMPQRASKDKAFHREWAKSNSLGFIQWEVLNRVHRIFNHLGAAVPGKK